ncbi:hypothetical protein [Flavobacterium humidisoli]|jgi:hypothetical protein|uniref:Uncharacterized protein n=1 Tax=Flavobacterium humidisoli TaxID=2937442 RepID=A0ABY4LQ22_9FLAO|nr:hypothetical protein [Flavobacterium humidisoli]UPZ14324.1 hypothetical protein M0M44_16325 [Flavobacterium humidisoli]
MKNTQINFSPNNKTCTDRTLVCDGDNNELIFRKTYVGDWGDWDEKPDNILKDQHLYLDQNTSFTNAI